MTMETVGRAHQARPFRPFSLRLADGRSIEVRRPEFAAYNPRGRVVLVLDENDGVAHLDVRFVDSIDFNG